MRRFFENSLFYFYFRFFFLLSGSLLQREEKFTRAVQCKSPCMHRDFGLTFSFCLLSYVLSSCSHSSGGFHAEQVCICITSQIKLRASVSFTIISRNSFACEIPIVTQSLLSIYRFLHDCSSKFFLFDSPGIVNSSTSSMSPWIIRCCTRFITSYVTRNQALRRVIFVFYIRKGTITASDRRWSPRSCRVSFDFLSSPLTIPTNLPASSIFGHVETTILLWNRCEFSRPITFPLRIRISFFRRCLSLLHN